jgi:hypothetical protein
MANLIGIIAEDKVLGKGDRDEQGVYKAMAVVMEEDLFTNIDLTSMELFKKYRHITDSPSHWQRFLNHKPIKDYIAGFLNEKAEKAAKLAMTGGLKASEAVKVVEHISKNQVKEDNSNIVVVFMPQKLNWGELDE